MTKLFGYKKKLLLFIAGIFILSFAGFLLISCGAGPQIKTTVPDKGNYALKFSGSEAVRADRTLGLGSSLLNSALTFEAWIKTSDPIAASSAFATRGTTSGAVLFLDNGSHCDPLGVTAGMPVFTNGNDAYVCGTTALNDGAWHHVAGVIAMEDHTGVHADCTTTICTAIGTPCSTDSADAGAFYYDEIPHLDLYVDGVYQDCAASVIGTNDIDTATGGGTYIGHHSAFSTSVGALSNFIGTVDEVRLWGVARTAGEIWQCRAQELSVFGGTCGIDSTKLHGYWKLNEGTGHKATDFSGRSIDGSTLYPATDAVWNGVWVEGYPF